MTDFWDGFMLGVGLMGLVVSLVWGLLKEGDK